MVRASRAPPPFDPALKRLELEGLGRDPEWIDDYLTGLLAEAEQANEIDVLPENMPAIEIFVRCAWTMEAGVPAQEIIGIAQALGLPMTAELFDGVRTMVSIAQPLLTSARK